MSEGLATTNKYKEESNQVTFSLDTRSNYSPPLISSKHAGHIYKGPTITALNKSSLGSIPSSIETVLFSKPKQIKLLPHENLGIFSPSGENILKVSFTSRNTPEQFQLNTVSLPQASKHNKKKTKQYEPLRFNYSSLENSKYLPGPADYSPKITLDNQNHYRIRSGNSLFGSGRNENDVNSLYFNINEMNKLGPGSYNIESSLSNKNGYGFCKDNRFKEKKLDNSGQRVGPGLYNVKSSFDNGSKNDKTSFFFKNERNRDCLDNKVEDTGPGPGYYHLEREFDKKERIAKKKSFGDIRKELMKKEEFSEDNNNNDKKEVVQFKKRLIWFEEDDNDYLKGKPNRYGNVMNSKSPRFKTFGNVSADIMHVPGPCYYKPMKYDKRSFNSNIHSNWI